MAMNVSKEEFIAKLSATLDAMKAQRMDEIRMKKDGARQADDFLAERRWETLRKSRIRNGRRWGR